MKRQHKNNRLIQILRSWMTGVKLANEDEIAQYTMQRYFRRIIIAYNQN
jgi:hypothetical protein